MAMSLVDEFKDQKKQYGSSLRRLESRISKANVERVKQDRRKLARCREKVIESAGVPKDQHENAWICEIWGNLHIFYGGDVCPEGKGHSCIILSPNGEVTRII